MCLGIDLINNIFSMTKMCIKFMLCFQRSVIDWAKDHRLHHKYSDTDIDPHNINRGFFFSHLGWLLYERHPESKKKLKEVDVSDLLADPILAFQHKYYLSFMPFITFFLPTIIPMLLWNETFENAFCVNMLQYVVALNTIALINSAAHRFGSRPFDR